MVDYTYCSLSTSKGLSYLISYTVQATIIKLLKKLPTAVRPIYREYYGDIMASRARSKDSTDAMARLVDEDFLDILRDHNRLANLTLAEIEEQKNSHETVKFPLVGYGREAEYDDENGEDGQVVRPQKRNAMMAKQTNSG
jgi:hypothetical protein